MKITVSQDILQKKLSVINHAISAKSQLPILLNILLEANDQELRLSSTDLEIGIQVTLPVEVEEAGSTTVPAKTFTELISSLGTHPVTLQTTEQGLTVISTHTKSMFQTLPSEDFPSLYEEKGHMIATLTATDLKNNFSSVVFAASADTSRPALSGVLLRKETEGFLLVATDGYRLSLQHYAIKETGTVSAEDQAMIVPARVFREVIALKDGETVQMYVGDKSNQVLFEQADSILVGRLIEAEYPPFEKIIPSEFSIRAGFDREELQKAVKICSIFARDSANIIKLSLQKQKIIVSSQSPSVGENTVEVEAEVSGEENEIAFNARYLQEFLANCSAEDLIFEMTGPLNPGVFKVKDDPSFLHLIMPVRIQQ